MTAPGANALGRPPGVDVAWMGLGVLAVSTAGPLIAVTVAPALAIAFWRNALGTVAIGPIAWWRHREELLGLSARTRTLCAVSGLMLAGHFAAWIPSLRLTSVASSIALVATQPIWVVLVARLRGQTVPLLGWLGIGLAMVGVVVVAGVDFSLSRDALVGDLLALVGAWFAAAYITIGAHVRREVSNLSYTFVVYATASAALLMICLLSGQQMAGYSPQTWIKLLALTAGAQLLGHTVFNHVLKTTSPTIVSLAILCEIPGAAFLAWIWLGQAPPAGVWLGATLLLIGIGVVIAAGQQSDSTTVPVTD